MDMDADFGLDQPSCENAAMRFLIIDDSVTSMVPAAQMDVDTAEAVAAAPVVKKTVEPAPKGDSIRDRDTSIAMRTIGVMPRAGQRYAVITTSDPKVTLVWLTKGDTL